MRALRVLHDIALSSRKGRLLLTIDIFGEPWGRLLSCWFAFGLVSHLKVSKGWVEAPGPCRLVLLESLAALCGLLVVAV